MPATTIASLALAGLFGATAAGKLAGHPRSLKDRDHLSIDAARWKQIGAIEAAGVGGLLIGLAVPEIGVAAAGGLALLSLGAAATHQRNHDPALKLVPAAVAFALSVTVAVLHATG